MAGMFTSHRGANRLHRQRIRRPPVVPRKTLDAAECARPETVGPGLPQSGTSRISSISDRISSKVDKQSLGATEPPVSVYLACY